MTTSFAAASGPLAAAPATASSNARKAINLARGRPYQLDPAPNYGTPTPVPANALTDGRLAGSEAHWVTGLSHGWQSVAPVTIDLDFEVVRAVGEVRLHVTNSPTVDIHWPTTAYLFESSDGYRYRPTPRHGRLVMTSPAGEAIEKGYLRFDLGSEKVRRIVVAIFATPLLMLDELEAFSPIEGSGAASTGTDREAATILRKDLGQRIRELRNDGVIEPVLAELAGQDRLPRDLADRRAPPWLHRKAGSVPPPTTAKSAPQARTASAETTPPCQARRIWPWQPFRLTGAALRPMPPGFDGTDVTIEGQPAWLAWEITNTSNQTTTLRELPKAAGGGLDIETRVLGYVATSTPAIVGDLLLERPDLPLPPGEAAVVLVKAQPRKAGVMSWAATARCGDRPLAFEARIHALQTPPSPASTVTSTPARPEPYFTAWAYPVEPLRRGLRCQPTLLSDYGIDVGTVFPSALGDIGSKPVAEDLTQQLQVLKDMRRILLFMNLRDFPSPWQKLDEAELAARTGRWLDQLQAIVKRSGYTGEILLYPIDEMRPAEVEAFQKIKRALAQGPYRFFGTLSDASMLRWRQQFDVASIGFTGDVKDRPELRSSEFYLAEGQAKERPPSRYYYSAPIVAAVRGSPGFGLWALVDSSGASAFQQGWSDIGVGERDFGMLYFDRIGCPMPSLRLAALSAGRTVQRILGQCAVAAPRSDWQRRLGPTFSNPASLKGEGELDEAPLGEVLATVSSCAAAITRAADTGGSIR